MSAQTLRRWATWRAVRRLSVPPRNARRIGVRPEPSLWTTLGPKLLSRTRTACDGWTSAWVASRAELHGCEPVLAAGRLSPPTSNPKVGGSTPSGRAIPTRSVPDHPVAARTWRHVPERAHPTAADLAPNPAPKRSRSEAAGWCYSGAGAVRSASSSVAIRMLSTSR